ncbi:MAG: hypothetical protein IKB61_02515 [Elusimicrobiaceae bacterium]|nr:hypothetical protein [Elusimicrobiaceae bacterium]MBR4355385.1 hypothetical protein [Elusimicrobiaceae bacterium]
MKIQKTGYIKLHRKFLDSHVHKLQGAAFRLFIDLLLLADREGTIDTSFRELSKVTEIVCPKNLRNALNKLKTAGAIKFNSVPNLVIKLENWSNYQARNCGYNTHTNCGENTHTPVGKTPTPCGYNTHTTENAHNKVPVQLTKEYKNIFKNSETAKKQNSKILNFQEPQTDLEKLIRFYLQLTKHPALNKPNANDLLNVVLKNDIPNFEVVLASCQNLNQAAKCVRQFIQDSNGKYNLFYLPRQIDSIRQKVEEQERREFLEQRRKNDEDREYMRILAEKEQWAREHGDDAGC